MAAVKTVIERIVCYLSLPWHFLLFFEIYILYNSYSKVFIGRSLEEFLLHLYMHAAIYAEEDSKLMSRSN